MSDLEHDLDRVRRGFNLSRWAIEHGEGTRFDSALNGAVGVSERPAKDGRAAVDEGVAVAPGTAGRE